MSLRPSKIRFDLERVDVIDMLEALGMENVTEATEDEANFSCPFPDHQHGDQKPSAYMNLETSAWFCQGCKRRGNAITFLADFGNISIMEASRFLRERYGGTDPDPDSFSIKSELERRRKKRERLAAQNIPTDVVIDQSIADEFTTNWTAAAVASDRPEWCDYIFNRGFDWETLEDWEIGYSEYYDRLTIPVRNRDGKLAGFKGRSWNHRKPKYLVLGNDYKGNPMWERYLVSQVVFGLHRAKGELIIVEGELNVVALWQMGIFNAVALNGSNFSDRQAKLIRSVADRVIVYLDSNDAGFIGTNMVCTKLRDYMQVLVVPDHEGDPGDAIDTDPELSHITVDSVRETLQDALSETRIRTQHKVLV